MVQFLFQQSIYMTLQFGKSLINLLLEQSGSQIYSWTQNRFANMEYFNVFLLHIALCCYPHVIRSVAKSRPFPLILLILIFQTKYLDIILQVWSVSLSIISILLGLVEQRQLVISVQI